MADLQQQPKNNIYTNIITMWVFEVSIADNTKNCQPGRHLNDRNTERMDQWDQFR